jgi:hypothetical protein
MMQFRRITVVLIVIGCLVLVGLVLANSPARAEVRDANAAQTAVSTGFTYQGRL